MYRDLRRPESIFLETGILPLTTRILTLELVEDGLAQHTFTLAVDEHDALALLVFVLLHHFNKFLELVVQHISIAKAMGIV